MNRLVTKYFCGPDYRYGPYHQPGDAGGEAVGQELLGGVLYRYDLADVDNMPVTLQLYRDVSQVGGRLWEQEVRVLQQTAGRRHPALPTIVDGGYEDGVSGDDLGRDSFAFVVTTGGVHRLVDQEDAIPTFQTEPLEAVRHLVLLADALSILHNRGIAHRNLWPGTIDVQPETRPSEGRFRLVLSRFEMSTMVANLLRSATLDAGDRGRTARRLFLDQGHDALKYCPPERIDFLYPEPDSSCDLLDDDRSDAYGLAAMAWEWFFGPHPNAFAGVALDDAGEVRRRATKLLQRMRRVLDEDRKLPRALRRLLHDMLEPDRRSRLTVGDAVTTLSEEYEGITGYWTESSSELPLLVTFMPAESAPTLLQWKLIERDPSTPQGRVELADFIEQDLRHAELVHAPYGADPYVNGGEKHARRQARQLLVGSRVAWFCHLYQPQSPIGGRRGPELETALLVKYVQKLDSSLGRRLLTWLERVGHRSRRRLPAIQAVSTAIHPVELAKVMEGRPSWKELIHSITLTAEPTAGDELVYEQAFDWLLDYELVRNRAREYAVVCDGSGATDAVVLRYDRERDEARVFGSALATQYAQNKNRRPVFGDFFSDFADGDDDSVEADDNELELLPDDRGRPGNRTKRVPLRFRIRRSDDAIEVVRPRGSAQIPERGWLRPAADVGSRVALQRQLDARWELLESRVLLSQLRSPSTIRGFARNWEGAHSGLDDSGAAIVTDMLVSYPFFALQGPPGTGKTEIVARAIGRYLEREPSDRVLVSAQSHHALDNLARRILGRLSNPDAVIALRAASPSAADRVHKELKPYLLGPLTESTRDRMLSQTRKLLQERAKAPTSKDSEEAKRARAITEVLERWEKIVETAGPELADRLLRGANLVFATCSSATPDVIAPTGASAAFDWVVIEEAAKAWPTELAIPLVRGVRWTLVGDHAQLGAYRRDDVERFLIECGASDNSQLTHLRDRHQELVGVFDLFGNLFEYSTTDKLGRDRPVRQLARQFRMRDPICQVVSRAFYPKPPPPNTRPHQPALGVPPPGLLVTARADSDSGLREPEFLRKLSLVWLDTAAYPDCEDADDPRWTNRGEVELVRRLVNEMRPVPATNGKDEDTLPLAILTPYRRQLDLLRRHTDIASRAFTIDSFQGRQADIVIVSLVRDKVRGNPDAINHATASMGHLTAPARANVLLSRARQLLVVIGRFQHYRDSGVPHWERVCACFGTGAFGEVIPARTVMLD